MNLLHILILLLPLSNCLSARNTLFNTVANSAINLNEAIVYNTSEYAADSEMVASLLPNDHCQFGMFNTSDGCKCNHTFDNILQCTDSGGHLIHPKILRAHWIGLANVYGNGSMQLVAGLCKFCASGEAPEVGIYVNFDPTSQCTENNRTGTLCSRCADGMAPAVNSHRYECVTCKMSKFFLFMLIQIGCLSFLMLFIYIFDFFPASGALNASVFFAQTISSTLQPNGIGYIPVQNISNSSILVDDVLDAVYGMWNLVFVSPAIRPFCYFEQMNSMMSVLMMDYVIAFLPLLLIGFILLIHISRECCGKILKPYDKCRGFLENHFSYKPGPVFIKITGYDARKSKQTLFASALLLSYTKFFITTFYILTPTTLVDKDGHYVQRVVFFDGEWKYLSNKHLYYAIPALCIGVFVLLGFPLSLLVLRYDKALNYGNQIPQSKRARCAAFCGRMLDHYLLHPFQRDFQWGHKRHQPCSGVKVGKLSWGLHDFRWMAGWYFLLRLSLFATFTLSIDFMVQIVVQQLLCVLGVIVSVSLRPYRYWLHNRIDACIFLLLASINTLSMYQYHWSSVDQNLSKWAFWLQYTIAFIPAAMMAGYFFAKLRWNWTREDLALPEVSGDYGDEESYNDNVQVYKGDVRHRNINVSTNHTMKTQAFLSSVDTVHRVPLLLNDEEVNVADVQQSQEESWISRIQPKKYPYIRLCSCGDVDSNTNP